MEHLVPCLCLRYTGNVTVYPGTFGNSARDAGLFERAQTNKSQSKRHTNWHDRTNLPASQMERRKMERKPTRCTCNRRQTEMNPKTMGKYGKSGDGEIGESGLRAGKWCMDFLTPLIVCAIAGSTWSSQCITSNSSPAYSVGWFGAEGFQIRCLGFQRRNQRRMWGASDPQHVLKMCCIHNSVNYKLISALMQTHHYLHGGERIWFGNIFSSIIAVDPMKVVYCKDW